MTIMTTRVEALLKLLSKGPFDPESQLLVPTDIAYQASENSYWSNTARLDPACIIRPKSSVQVSEILRILVDSNEKFAIRSGGHAPLAGSNNIHGGVTIDLGLLDDVQFDRGSETVSFGPGVRWGHVYQEVEKHGYAVAGGREVQTGVGGFLLGGGNTWMTGSRGFACDNVVAFETVLADGRIIVASATTHSDLFRALKGGSNNFGIVTRFTMSAFPCRLIWGGITVTPKEYSDDAIRMTSTFTEKIAEYPDSSIVTVLTHLPEMKDVVVSAGLVETKGVENSPAFREWSTLPKILDTTKLKTLYEIGVETYVPSDYFTTWFTISVKNDQRILAKAVEVHGKLVEDMRAYIPENDFITQWIFQPLPRVFSQHSVAAGGNVLGLERNEVNAMMLQLSTMVRTADQRAFAYSKVRDYVAEMKEFAASVDGLLDWIYMNYADSTQDVLAGYGAENVKFMRDVADKYDPHQVFQKLCPGGFKISDATS
ncbi:hypothetical protein M426DRAFT_25053 [Hypoxylon sp. CI-4A]|nr:hypothetical protein M426DRAFT_25053 [Hypoxylon sp. CI-4A]